MVGWRGKDVMILPAVVTAAKKRGRKPKNYVAGTKVLREGHAEESETLPVGIELS